MERKKRIIYESDEDEEEKSPQISIEKEKKIPILTTPAIATKTEAENGIVNSDEEWDSQECLEFMHGRCDDEVGAIPIKIINEQLGDDGVEYEVTFEERRGKGRVSVYHDWVRDVDLTKRMLVLKEEYEQGNDRGGSATDEQNVDGTYSSDENVRPHPPAAAHAPMAIIGSNERVPGAPRRSSRGSSSGTRRAVTRQKLNDLIELRNRSKSGLGVLQLSSEDEEESKSDVENGATPPEEEDGEDDELVIRGRHRLIPPSPPHKVKSQVSHTPRMFKRRREVNDEEEEEEDDEEQDDRAGGRGGREDNGIESFIVNDDEGEEELYEEEVLEERRRKRARRKEKEKAAAAAVSHRRKRSHNRKVILDDDEEEEEEEEEEKGEEESEEEKMKRRRRGRGSSAASPQELEDEYEAEEENDDDEDNEEEESDEESEEEETDFSLYRRLGNLNDEFDESTPIVFRQNMSVPEAMTLYIDMIVKLLSPHSSSSSTPPHSSPSSSSHPQFGTPQRNRSHRSSLHHREDLSKISSEHKTAIRKIEGLICTSRESLLGSSAWKGEFYEQLKTRPFYTVIESPSGGSAMCEACSRVSAGAVYVVYLYGPTYDSSRIWDNLRWLEHVPECILPSQFTPPSPGISSSVARVSLRDRDDDEITQRASESSSSSSAAGEGKLKHWFKSNWPAELTREKETRWTVTNHCMRRTQLYHTLLHYKLRLILKIKSKLDKLSSGGSSRVASITEDTNFISCETARFQTLVTNAGQKYGGEEQAKFTLWSDEDNSDSQLQQERSSSSSSSKKTPASPHRPPIAPSASGSSVSKSPGRRRGFGASLDQWLVKKK